MIDQDIITSKGFVYLRSSQESVSNGWGDRDDYVGVGLVGEAFYLLILSHLPATGSIRIRDYFNDPIIAPEYYAIGEVNTEEELDALIATMKFDEIKPPHLDELNNYR